MGKTILVTGSTDGIGLLTAKKLVADGHIVLLHGRNPEKLNAAAEGIGGNVETYCADLSKLEEVKALADSIRQNHDQLDVLINNAGILKTPHPIIDNGLDIRFLVNTLSPYLLTKLLVPIIPKDGRIVNLSSAAQAPVNTKAMSGEVRLDDMTAYAQSKLAITIWTRECSKEHAGGPVFIAVNPASLLASKMVKEGFGVAGKDMNIGADILIDAALGGRFSNASGEYFDNDIGQFSEPHPAALDAAHSAEVMQTIQKLLTDLVPSKNGL